jgi:hypothetical protein
MVSIVGTSLFTHCVPTYMRGFFLEKRFQKKRKLLTFLSHDVCRQEYHIFTTRVQITQE